MGKKAGLKWSVERLQEIEKWQTDNNATATEAAAHFGMKPHALYSARSQYKKRLKKANRKTPAPKVTARRTNKRPVAPDLEFELPPPKANDPAITILVVKKSNLLSTLGALWG